MTLCSITYAEIYFKTESYRLDILLMLYLRCRGEEITGIGLFSLLLLTLNLLNGKTSRGILAISVVLSISSAVQEVILLQKWLRGTAG